jgi:hypothetical protein
MLQEDHPMAMGDGIHRDISLVSEEEQRVISQEFEERLRKEGLNLEEIQRCQKGIATKADRWRMVGQGCDPMPYQES